LADCPQSILSSQFSDPDKAGLFLEVNFAQVIKAVLGVKHNYVLSATAS
jgi:hypothetical protein